MSPVKIGMLFLLSAALIRADDIKLTDGTVFKDAKIISHNDKSATIAFAAGVAMVKIELVPPLLLQEPILANFPGTATNPPAPPVSPPAAAPPTPAEISPATKLAIENGVREGLGPILKIMPDGLIVDLTIINKSVEDVPHHEAKSVNIVPDGLGHTPVNQIVTRTWTTTEVVRHPQKMGIAFVACKTDEIDQSDLPPWNGEVWKVGTYIYTDGQAGRHTLDKYTAAPKEAYEYYAAHPIEIPPPQVMRAEGEVINQSPVSTSTSLSTQPMNP